MILTSVANADDFPDWLAAAAANKDGGVIELTVYQNSTCKGEWYIAAANNSAGKVAYGCWTFIKGGVGIAWMDGTRTSYDATAFRWADWAVNSQPPPAGPAAHAQPHVVPQDDDTKT